MNAEYVQGLRYKLQKRYRRLNSAGQDVFHYCLLQFWNYLRGEPALLGILDDLRRRCAQYEADAQKIFVERQPLMFESELEGVGISYFLIERCVGTLSERSDDRIEVQIGGAYGHHKTGEGLEFFRTYFLEPLYEYIDEQLDDQRALLSLLVRYKQRCEWFNRQALCRAWEADTSKGENTLAFDLYEYLHDQGISFHLEPSSASGKIDIISAQESESPLLADAKIFNPEKGKGKNYLASGFNQLYQYTLDYNEPVGYLVIYKTCEPDLRLALSNRASSVPYVIHNNKTIFLLVVDIFPHSESASKRGPLKPIEITEDDLIRSSRQETTG